MSTTTKTTNPDGSITITTVEPPPKPKIPAVTGPPSKVEDYILLVVTLLGAAGSFFLGPTAPMLFNMSPFLLGAVLANVGKGLSGLKDPKSYEDWVLTISGILGGIAAAFSANPTYAVVGIIIGQVGKAVLSLQYGFNAEDVLLVVMAFLTGLGQASGSAGLRNIGLLLGPVSKALPSLGIGTQTTTTTTGNTATTTTTTPKPA